MFDCFYILQCIILLGTFNKLGGAKLHNEGRQYDEQEGFFNSIFSNYYLPFIITVIYSLNIKEIHLTIIEYRLEATFTCEIKCSSFFILRKFPWHIHNSIFYLILSNSQKDMIAPLSI